MFITSKSKFDFSSTIDKISDELLNSNWKIITIHDLQETMHKNGKEVLPVKVIEACRPDMAYKILSLDDPRAASVMMPCRISVFEKYDSCTYISRMDIKKFENEMSGISKEVMMDVFNEVENMMKNIF